MKKWATLLAGLALVAASSAMLIGCSKDPFYISGPVQKEMDKAVEGALDGMIVYVHQAGESRLYSAGFHDRENQLPADANALFRIASISKLYEAAAVTKLVAAGDLQLDQTLAGLVPETANRVQYADRITLKHLISHRSGIPEYIYNPEFESGTTEPYIATAALIFDQPANFEPGEKYAYSNTNYLLLGEILDRTLGYSHHQYIRTELLEPLALNNTFSLYSEVDSNRVMSGYLIGWDDDLKSIDHTRPGGAMVATAEDVGLFLRGLIDGTLFNEAEQAIYSSVYSYEHTGWINGYTSIARYHSDIDAVVIQFVNTSGTGLFWVELERTYSRVVGAISNEA